MKIFIDIDNTIFNTIGNNYKECTPKYENIENIITIAIPNENNSYGSEELKNILSLTLGNVQSSDSIQEAIKVTSEKFPDSRILICGSLYLAGKVLELN